MQSSYDPCNSPVVPGRYTVHDFQGEHAHPVCSYLGNYVYHHETSVADVEVCQSGGVNIKFNLKPVQDGRPALGSIYSEYELTLYGIKVSSEAHFVVADMISVANAQHDIKGLNLIMNPINGCLSNDEFGNGGVIIKFTEVASFNYHLKIEVSPNEVRPKDCGKIVSLLQSIGLFQKTTITGRLELTESHHSNTSSNPFSL